MNMALNMVYNCEKGDVQEMIINNTYLSLAIMKWRDYDLYTAIFDLRLSVLLLVR